MAARDEGLMLEHQPSRWYSTNMVGIPADLVASVAFNEHPQALRIAGTREANAGLFRLLDDAVDQADAADRFAHYMDAVFGLEKPDPTQPRPRERRFRASYLKLLQGWGFDSNSPQGAVLKGWVESRFGITPSFHKSALDRYPSPAWTGYLEEKFNSRFHNNCINMQLDALYEFCQWSLVRFAHPLCRLMWRGTNHMEEQILSGSLRSRECITRLNNLVSFSLDAERASEFGDWVLKSDVPACKLLFFPGLLNDKVLNAEGEALVIGGLYRVEARYG
ncbi:NAD(+)--dinitrogen-reductase ADP-D-ribosyltransferase [Viridibacterium curvum]|uniref:NAD(+)--dinitrogen-reductase ADP-D-ribosyltransferase n=1 Tax=Viridibacterium curvum TaxID=1101404 RepID=A0ABP9R5M9_9RHOO